MCNVDMVGGKRSSDIDVSSLKSMTCTDLKQEAVAHIKAASMVSNFIPVIRTRNG